MARKSKVASRLAQLQIVDDPSEREEKPAPKHAKHYAPAKGGSRGFGKDKRADADKAASEAPDPAKTVAVPAMSEGKAAASADAVEASAAGTSEFPAPADAPVATASDPVSEAPSSAGDPGMAEPPSAAQTVVAPAAARAGATGTQEGIGFVAGATVNPPSGSYEGAPPSHAGRRAAIAVAVFVGVLAAIYFAGVFVFSTRFFPNTKINGEDVSFAAVSDIASKHSSATEGYRLSVEGAGLSFAVEGADLNLHIDGERFANWAHSQTNPWAWPVELVKTHDLSAEELTAFDEAKLSALVTAEVAKVNEGATAPTNATVAYDGERKSYAVTPETVGTVLDEKAVLAKASEAVATMATSASIGEAELAQPTRRSDDPGLVAAAEQANSWLGATQVLRIKDKDVYTVDADRIANWISVDDSLQVSLNEDAVREWTQGELSEQLDTVGRTHAYTRPDGKQVSVEGGTYGWSIDGAALATSIADNIRSGTASTALEVPLLQSAETFNPGGQEWGSRYIDIDISEQHVRLYDGGNVVWESDCVTGNTSTGHGTPLGVYTMNPKSEGNVRLEGKEDPLTGEPEYVSFVTYWMPFINDAVALHDASWRYSFGGSIYQTDGSHGCVNLPSAAAEQLYGICDAGDVVITHW